MGGGGHDAALAGPPADRVGKFRTWIAGICGTAPAKVVADGKWHRFRIEDTRSKSSTPGAYLLHMDEHPVGLFMDWRKQGEKFRWTPGTDAGPVDRAEFRRLAKESEAKRKAEHAKAAANALTFFQKECVPINGASHPYLDRKKIAPHGTRQGSGRAFGLKDEPCVIIPIRGPDNKALTLQAIRADGERRFWPGSTTDGGYTLIGRDDGQSTIVLCEGFATGGTIHEATGWLVVVCLSASNMVRLSRWAGHRWAGRSFMVAGDDDWHLELKEKPQPNEGREAAIKAARNLGCRYVMPDMQGAVTEGGDDFNDQACTYGIGDVSATFLQALESAKDGVSEPRRELLDANISGDQSIDIGDASSALEHAEAKLGFRIADWSTDRYLGPAPAIEWLIEGVVPLGSPGLLASLGGLGKSYKVIDLGLEIAVEIAGAPSGRKVLGGSVKRHGSVVILNAEDSQKSIHRRLAKIDPDETRRKAGRGKIFIVPLPATGGPKPFINGGQPPTCTENFHALMTVLDAIDDLVLVIADPLQAFVMADVTSDPAAAQFMWTAFAELCARKGASFMFTHHMRKDGSAKIATAEDAREAIRGVTTLVDGSRFSYCLWTASDEDARMICSQAEVAFEPRKVVHGAVVKANDEHDNSIHTYIRAPSGLLEDAGEFGKQAKAAKAGLTALQVAGALMEITRRWEDKNPFSKSVQSGGRYLGRWLEAQYGLPKKVARDQVDSWVMNEVLIEELCDKHLNLKGVQVEKWPEEALVALAQESRAKVRESSNSEFG